MLEAMDETAMKTCSLAKDNHGAAVLLPVALFERLSANERFQIIDVREYPEYAAGHIAGSQLVPLVELESRASELNRQETIVCVCHSGKRSAQAADKLVTLGFHHVYQLAGGLLAWEEAKLPLEKTGRRPWLLERQVRLAAGLLVVAGLGLSLLWPPAVGLAWFVGAGLIFAALTNWCGMGLLLARLPWNRAGTLRK
jgi:rhodanese-related sulfurtransferase